ncbi:MAG: LD-carboxypeptidase [Bacteroidia bacterium]|nr:LD-carboxypeptidase [Bacteroidia bacterium]MDW8159734.1 LD-carboxypeptidase [Bacteroidia bacterium]
MFLQSPPLLEKGSIIGLVAPASGIEGSNLIEEAIGFWQKNGYNVKLADNLRSRLHQFAGTDMERWKALQSFLDNPEIGAIHCMRGGYGTIRILSKICWNQFLKYPKWIIGYSDITLLLNAVNSMGFEAIHGPLGTEIARAPENCKKALLKILETGQSNFFSNSVLALQEGESTGKLIGGNFTLLHHLIATPWEPCWESALLILEDIGEYYYHLDRMTQHFILTRKWEKLNGIIIGSFTDCQEKSKGIGKNIEQIIYQLVENPLKRNIPVVSKFPAGHIPENFPLVLGREYKFKVTIHSCTLTSSSN